MPAHGSGTSPRPEPPAADPALAVVRGSPTSEELAAVLVGLAVTAAQAPVAPGPVRPPRSVRAAALRRPLPAGGWRASARQPRG